VPDRHERDKTTFRPPPDIKRAAQEAIAAQDDWTMNDVLVACLSALAADPAAFLALLLPHKPPQKRGRPPKQP
jgi:hypothetical protein